MAVGKLKFRFSLHLLLGRWCWCLWCWCISCWCRIFSGWRSSSIPLCCWYFWILVLALVVFCVLWKQKDVKENRIQLKVTLTIWLNFLISSTGSIVIRRTFMFTWDFLLPSFWAWAERLVEEHFMAALTLHLAIISSIRVCFSVKLDFNTFNCSSSLSIERPACAPGSEDLEASTHLVSSSIFPSSWDQQPTSSLRA